MPKIEAPQALQIVGDVISPAGVVSFIRLAGFRLAGRPGPGVPSTMARSATSLPSAASMAGELEDTAAPSDQPPR